MKKKILGMSFILAMGAAQAQKMEVSASYGTPSLYGITNSIFSGLAMVFYDSDLDLVDSNGVLNVSFNLYSPSMKWRYGIDLSHEFFDTNDSKITKESYTTISPKIDVFWNGSNRKLRVYTGVSAGILVRNAKFTDDNMNSKTYNNTIFGFNITPIGMRFGGKFAGFVESNIGTQGFFKGGIAYQF
ncbi:MAG TPA: hypothetical protein VL022_05170 [Moheibacter sp.]|nr:hypothetical protein [Moheibacter sp.]